MFSVLEGVNSEVIIDLLAGCISGGVSQLVLYPFDNLMMRQQAFTEDKDKSNESKSGYSQQQHFKQSFEITITQAITMLLEKKNKIAVQKESNLMNIIKEEGILGLYIGFY